MASTIDRFKVYRPPGPVARSFLHDQTSLVKFLMGPVGGGKTVTCIFDTLAEATQQPVCRDGVIRHRVAIIGQTYGQLEKNLIKTWQAWLPPDGGGWTEADFTGGGGRYAVHKIRLKAERQGKVYPVEYEAIFAAIGEHSIEQFMRGFEPSQFYLFEADLLSRDVLMQAIPRLGRYPAAKDLPPGAVARKRVIGDLNAPDIDSWVYQLFEENKPPGYMLYKQPGGRSPQAENRKNLPVDYYDVQVREMALNTPRLVKRYVDAQYAPSADGEPIYPEYSDDQHLSPVPLKPVQGLPIDIGADGGIQRPAAVFGQWLKNGQWRILGEYVPGRKGPKGFAEGCKTYFTQRFPGFGIGELYVDPAAFAGSDKESGDLAWAETLAFALGVPAQPAPSNEIGIRLDAVRDELTYRIDGETPALVLSRQDCPMLRKGFASHYRYRKEQVGTTTRTSDKPDKTDESHPHDALQYLLLGNKGRFGVIHQSRKPEERGPQAAGRVAAPAAGKFKVKVKAFG